jgi:hypothetical protein
VATYLDVLVELLRDPVTRAAYLADPVLWLRDSGLGYLCGEDVVAAGPYLCSWFPDLTAAFDAVERHDPAPRLGESELDAAVRVVQELLDAVPLDDVLEVPEVAPDPAGAEVANLG